MQYGNHEVVFVGIAGKKRHGKDTFARGLAAMLHPAPVYTRPFAAALKDEVADELDDLNIYNRFEVARQALDTDGEKERFRLLLQWWGTEFRRHEQEDYWLQKLEEWAECQCSALIHQKPVLVIVPDVRFPDEAHFIRDRGGLLVHVARPSLPSEDTHPSETALDDFEPWDWQALNDGSVADLAHQAQDFANAAVRERLR